MWMALKKGNPSPAGFGGVLRDHMGCVLVRFSKSVGVAKANLTELLAVRESFVIFTAMTWANDHFLVVESDSKSVVCWVSNP
ncbi:hypothetical protein PTKIN_Ptkin03bG0142600 [Pterospermum kingtungense]